MNEPIRFYGVDDAFGAFSNFAPYPITLRGRRGPTSEHFFQAQKFEDAKACEAIRAVNTRRPRSAHSAATRARAGTHVAARHAPAHAIDPGRTSSP